MAYYEPSFIAPCILEDVQEYKCSARGGFTYGHGIDPEDVPKYCSMCGELFEGEKIEEGVINVG